MSFNTFLQEFTVYLKAITHAQSNNEFIVIITFSTSVSFIIFHLLMASSSKKQNIMWRNAIIISFALVTASLSSFIFNSFLGHKIHNHNLTTSISITIALLSIFILIVPIGMALTKISAKYLFFYIILSFISLIFAILLTHSIATALISGNKELKKTQEHKKRLEKLFNK